MRVFCVLSILVGISNADFAEVQDLAIRGWWSQCNFGAGGLGDRCNGTLVETQDTLVPLDPSGDTCYVNPAADFNTITWFGKYSDKALNESVGEPVGLSPEVHMWSIVLDTNSSSTAVYLPTNCTFGICSCDSIEPLRIDWQDNVRFCPTDKCFSISIVIARLKEEPCSYDNGITGRDTVTGELLFGACWLLASLEEIGTDAPSDAPTAMPASVATKISILGVVVLFAMNLF
jgi:hypothetical protein